MMFKNIILATILIIGSSCQTRIIEDEDLAVFKGKISDLSEQGEFSSIKSLQETMLSIGYKTDDEQYRKRYVAAVLDSIIMSTQFEKRMSSYFRSLRTGNKTLIIQSTEALRVWLKANIHRFKWSGEQFVLK